MGYLHLCPFLEGSFDIHVDDRDVSFPVSALEHNWWCWWRRNGRCMCGKGLCVGGRTRTHKQRVILRGKCIQLPLIDASYRIRESPTSSSFEQGPIRTWDPHPVDKLCEGDARTFTNETVQTFFYHMSMRRMSVPAQRIVTTTPRGPIASAWIN